MYEEQLTWPAPLRALVLLLPLLIGVVAFLPGGSRGLWARLLPVLFLSAISALVWSMTTLRVRVTEQEVVIRLGPFGERIPRSQLVAWAPTTYRWQEWGGFGLRIRRGGRLYNVPGDGGQAVQLTLDTGKMVLCSTRDPHALCAALDILPPHVR